ncbi:hypothetical protein BT63DRAFT_285592 [Microthyrium microscopicum]|uniref:Uncharacterized protein n=1 Tax=Microthyrium microscopicum TaxID=703497 RepID=A0A6A6UD00_9PEZI|nr:hypothetical protein BT63DRAFT_285592 [Microthyrium microscopicum]
MPLRIKKCPDPATLHSCTSPKRPFRSQRELHSFWNHGAPSPTIPPWWDTLLNQMCILFTDTLSKPRSSPKSDQPTSGMLDFLYPPKTLALMRRLSRTSIGTIYFRKKELRMSSPAMSARKRVQISGHGSIGYRKQSTLADGGENPQPPPHYAEHNEQSDELNFQEIKLQELDWIKALRASKAEDGSARKDFLSHIQGTIPLPGDNLSYSHAWALYRDLPPEQQTIEAKIQLANFLSFSDSEEDSVRLFFITNSPGFDETYAFWRATVVHLFTGRIDNAAKLHAAARQRDLRTYIGSDVLLAHAIRAKDWQRVLQVSTEVYAGMTESSDLEGTRQQLQDLWRVAIRLPGLTDIVDAYLTYAVNRLDVQYYVTSDSIISVLEMMKRANVNEKRLLRYALISLCDKIQESTNQSKHRQFHLLRLLWTAYLKSAKSTGGASPSLIEKILSTLTFFSRINVVSATQTQQMLEEICSVASQSFMNLPYAAIVSMMTLFSRKGNLSIVQSLNSSLRPTIGELSGIDRNLLEMEQDTERVCSLLRVHVVAGNFYRTEEFFSRLSQLFPRILQIEEVWIEVIRSHARARRFGAAFEIVFDRMPKAGCHVTRHTLRELIAICGAIGDAKAVTTLISITRQENVPIDLNMLKHVVLAHIRSEDTPAAAKSETLLKKETDFQDGHYPVQHPGEYGIEKTKFITAVSAKDYSLAMSIFNGLEAKGVPIDGTMYLNLVRLHCRSKNTNQAQKIVDQVLPKSNIPTHAGHYALLMQGYFHEYRYTDCLKAYDELVQAGQTPDVTSRALRLAAFCRLNRPEAEEDRHVLALLRANLSQTSMDLRYNPDFPPVWHAGPVDVHFYQVLEAFSEVGAWDLVNYVQKWYINVAHGGPSLSILKSLLKANALAGNHDEVEILWKACLRKLSAHVRAVSDELGKLSEYASKQVLNDMRESIQWIADDADGEDIDGLGEISMPGGYDVRHLLSWPLNWYITNLGDRREFDAIVEVVNEVQTKGFQLTSTTWNTYVQVLCRSESPRHVVAAFRAAEIHLNPDFSKYHQEITGNDEDAKLVRQALTNSQYRLRTKFLYIQPRTMIILKNILQAAKISSVDRLGRYFDGLASAVTLSSVLQQVAAKLTPAVEAWTGDKFVNHKSDYMLTRREINARDDKIVRQRGLYKRLEFARESAFGPNQLESFSQLMDWNTDKDLADESEGDIPDHAVVDTLGHPEPVIREPEFSDVYRDSAPMTGEQDKPGRSVVDVPGHSEPMLPGCEVSDANKDTAPATGEQYQLVTRRDHRREPFRRIPNHPESLIPELGFFDVDEDAAPATAEQVKQLIRRLDGRDAGSEEVNSKLKLLAERGPKRKWLPIKEPTRTYSKLGSDTLPGLDDSEDIIDEESVDGDRPKQPRSLDELDAQDESLIKLLRTAQGKAQRK